MAQWVLKADAALLACELKRQSLLEAWPHPQAVQPSAAAPPAPPQP